MQKLLSLQIRKHEAKNLPPEYPLHRTKAGWLDRFLPGW